MMALKFLMSLFLWERNRIISAEKAIKLGADILLLDDGFQYWDMKRDLDIILIDCTNPFGYGYSLPRGLLREPMEHYDVPIHLSSLKVSRQMCL